MQYLYCQYTVLVRKVAGGELLFSCVWHALDLKKLFQNLYG
jgi:hypothetical protein